MYVFSIVPGGLRLLILLLLRGNNCFYFLWTYRKHLHCRKIKRKVRLEVFFILKK
jgi:hypothetical protein